MTEELQGLREMARTEQENKAWDSFWQGSRLACCAGSEDTNYAAEFRQPWFEFFERLENGDSLLDVCTGNGAVPLLALDYAEQHELSLDLHGVDSADIDPGKYNPELGERLEKINFHAKTSVTELPFADESFDVVTSQYGIEYAPIEPAAAEVVRVLKKDASGQFVMHAKDGVAARQAREELQDIDELLHDIDIFPATSRALTLVYGIEERGDSASETDIKRAKAAFDDYYSRLTKLGEIWQQRTASDVLRSTGDILQHTFNNRHRCPLQQLLDKVDETRNAVIFHESRLEALLASARSAADCAQIENVFLRLGCSNAETTALENRTGDEQLGWRMNIYT